jgi:hypothetical protein
VSSLTRPWLHAVPWASVTAINASLCQAKSATHKPTSEGHEAARSLWEKNRFKELSLQELLQICFQCHRLAPFCNYNGNTFVAVVKTLLAETLSRMPADEAHVLRSIAGHIVAGTATNIETKQLDRILNGLKT